MEPDTLMTQLAELLVKGDEKGAETLLIQELPNLPEETRGEIYAALLEGALQDLQSEAVVRKIQSEGLEALDALDSVASHKK